MYKPSGAYSSRASELAEQVERLQRTVDELTREVERLRRLESLGLTEEDADGPHVTTTPKKPRQEPAVKKAAPTPSKASASEPRPAKPQAGVTFHLSDLKTGVACEPLDERADPTTDSYERYKRFFEEGTVDDTFLGPTMKVVSPFGDHMSSPLQKPTGDVVRDEQAVIREIMRYLWGVRQRMVREGEKMAPLDLQESVKVFLAKLEYTFGSHTEWDYGCYDSGSFEPGEHYTIDDSFTVFLYSEANYIEDRKRAYERGKAYPDARKAFEYDGSLPFETETEAFIQIDGGDSYYLHLHKPFGMKECLKVHVRL